MKEGRNVYKCFEGKKVIILTSSDFTYHTNKLEVLDQGILFVDNRGSQILLGFSEIKMIKEVSR